MKITIVCDVPEKGNYGASAAAGLLIRGMKARGHEVVVVSSDEKKRNKDGYSVISRSGLNELETLVWDSDLVHIMLPFSLGKAAMGFAVRHKIPVTADFRLSDGIKAPFGMYSHAVRAAVKRLYSGFYRYADAVRFTNETAEKLFKDAAGGKVGSYVIPFGIETDPGPSDSGRPYDFRDKFVILCSGGFTAEKRQSVLIDAAALSDHRREIQLIFAGCGPMLRELKERSSKLVNTPVFNMYPQSRMRSVFGYADLYVDPAEVDLEPYDCLCAAACGKPFIVSDSPLNAAKEFVYDKNCLFGNSDPADLAAAIDRFIEKGGAADEYPGRWKEISGRYSPEASIDAAEDMFYSVR